MTEKTDSVPNCPCESCYNYREYLTHNPEKLSLGSLKSLTYGLTCDLLNSREPDKERVKILQAILLYVNSNSEFQEIIKYGLESIKHKGHYEKINDKSNNG